MAIRQALEEGYRGSADHGSGLLLFLVVIIVMAGVAGLSLHLVLAAGATDWGGPLLKDTVLRASDNPHIVNSTVEVPAGITLTIEPGVELYFGPGASLIVRGRLLAEGTLTQTILFTRRDEGTYWGTIAVIESYTDNRISHAVIEYTREGLANPRSDGVTVVDSQLTLADSVLRFTESSSGVNAYWHSMLHVLRNEIHDIEGDGIRVNGGMAVIQGNHVYNTRFGIYPQEGIAIINMSSESPALVADNHIHDVSDDCLDVNDSWVIIERNRVYNCPDKGISIGTAHQVPAGTKATSATVVNNLVYGSNIGIAVKDSAVARLIHNTIAHNETEGLAVYELASGYGGGRATVANTILWGNGQSIRVDGSSSVSVTHSVVQGGWPGIGNSEANPVFRSVEDYRIGTGSAAIDQGREVGVAVDLDRRPRPVGMAPDLGAYELQPLLTAWSGDKKVYLAWQVAASDPPLASFAISVTAIARGTAILSPVLGLPTNTLAYTLTGAVNYTRYTVMVEGWDRGNDLLMRSNAVTVMPTDVYGWLPMILR